MGVAPEIRNTQDPQDPLVPRGPRVSGGPGDPRGPQGPQCPQGSKFPCDSSKVINVGSDTFCNPIFHEGLQN